MAEAAYSIWLLQTGIMPAFPRSGVLYGAHNEGTYEVPLGVVVLKGEDRLVLVDCGFRREGREAELAETYGVHKPRSLVELLPELDLTAEEVDTILLTHAHWDHMGNLDAFPNATVHVQEREWVGWFRAICAPQQLRWLRAGIDPADFHSLLGAAFAGRVRLWNGEVTEVLPGLDLRTAFDTHTFGGQYVLVRSPSGTWVVAGDAVLSYANLEGPEGYVPLGQAIGSQQRCLEVFDEILTAAGGRPDRVIPVHDLEVYARYPSRETVDGLRLAELALAPGEASRVTWKPAASSVAG